VSRGSDGGGERQRIALNFSRSSDDVGSMDASNRPPPSAPGPDLRPRAARAPLVHAVMCRFADDADLIEVTTLNISQSGMLVRGAVLPPIGSELEFKFFLETGFEILSGTGKVMRHATDASGHPSVGIAFGELDPPKQRILARIVELHSEANAA
jgi:hypothetical protein